MSRIQDILAKAERDGTVGRLSTMTAPSLATATVSQMPAPSTAGSSALDPAYAPIADRIETKAAVPTLHPALVAAISPHSSVAEQYRGIRARLAQREEAGPIRSIVITSPATGDGKSVTAANLALTMAQEFQRSVVLVDADLRGAAVHDLFGLDRGPGLAEVLAGTATLDEALVHLPDHRLTLLPAGETPAFPAELLGSSAMRRLIDALRSRYDRIVFDAPAVAPLADTSTLAPMTDGVVMVVRAGMTKRPALDEALRAFEEQKVVGVVLNAR